MMIVPVVGEKAHTSAFQAVTKKNEYCKTLCRKNYTPQQMEEFQVRTEIFLFLPTLSILVPPMPSKKFLGARDGVQRDGE